MIRPRFYLPLLLILLCFSCKNFRRAGLRFGDFKNIHFKEVKRVYTNGLQFNNHGYQLDSDKYIKSQDPKKIQAMSLPGKKDTAFIRKRIAQTSVNPDSSFAAREPVLLKSISPQIKVEKVQHESTPIEKVDPSESYMGPEFNITIHKAYEAFNYIMYVYIDDKGKMIFRNSVIPLHVEFKASYERIMRGIVNGYLMHYLDITPGKTLGMPHTTSLLLNVTGKVD
jgi:hypothetical protein